ncbi:MAG TPA: glutamine--fructose-6-phosphate transaminase (isomerizing) [Thermoanaerobaculia bacterium]|nr:glutamine--fructose-6-phosphate transaminase (isomerizing) [Thermoanaerobaculia bacterium]
MCGIVGYVGEQEVVPLLVDGLKRLEYRGYDSAGVAVVRNGTIDTCKAEGKLERLVAKLADQPLAGSHGLGHTRWATHGPPSERNAHPMVDSRRRLALIHNGIIENFLPLKRRLEGEGWTFTSDTDTEVIANLISSHVDTGASLLEAVQRAVGELEGMYAFAVVATGEVSGRDGDGANGNGAANAADGHQEIVAARQGPPLILGLGRGEQYLASDPAALLAHTRDVVFLENGDVARLTPSTVEVFGRDGRPVERKPQRLDWDPVMADKGGFRHYMAKEIHEQTQAVQDTFGGRIDFASGEVLFDGFSEELVAALAAANRLHVVACGTSWHAALIGKFLIEELARVPVEVDYGSEYRYRDPIVDGSVVAVGISQSGETADTLSAMQAARERGARLLAICNVRGSEATRVSDGTVYTHAGPEIGVASTKAFTTQLVALYLLALYLRQVRGERPDPELARQLAQLPQAIERALAGEREVRQIARRHHRASDFLFLGRGINYPIALEGALKLKEISYIHAEGYPAGEMKHGPIALIDPDMPVVAIATGDRVYDKVLSNMQEVGARDGIVIAVTDRPPEELEEIADEVIAVPRIAEWLQPIVNVVPLQLLAYHVGVRRGADVDQPRNLAKSVTVE